MRISTAIHRVNVYCDLIPKYGCCERVCVLCTYFCLCFVLSTGLSIYAPGHWSVTKFARQLKQKHFLSHKYYFSLDIKSTLAIIDLCVCVYVCVCDCVYVYAYLGLITRLALLFVHNIHPNDWFLIFLFSMFYERNSLISNFECLRLWPKYVFHRRSARGTSYSFYTLLAIELLDWRRTVTFSRVVCHTVDKIKVL